MTSDSCRRAPRRSRISQFPTLFAAGLSLLTACAGPTTIRRAARDDLAAVVLAALDGEALYTVAGGLKPVSSGFWRTAIDLDEPVGEGLDAMRRALQGLDDDSLSWGVQSFARDVDDERACHAWVAHRPALAALVARRADVFLPLGITPATRPAEVIAIIERQDEGLRFRCYGLLFGYPEHAVEFFVRAAAAGADTGGGLVPRDFLSIPTYASDVGRFVFAVPKGHQPDSADRALQQAAAPILADYRRRRAARADDLPGAALGLLEAIRRTPLADRWITSPSAAW